MFDEIRGSVIHVALTLLSRLCFPGVMTERKIRGLFKEALILFTLQGLYLMAFGITECLQYKTFFIPSSKYVLTGEKKGKKAVLESTGKLLHSIIHNTEI